MSLIPGLVLPNYTGVGAIMAALIKLHPYKGYSLRGTAGSSGSYVIPIINYSQVFPIHAVTQESYEYSAEVTQHAVESGVIFSDHVILKPVKVTGTFVVSNYDGLGSSADMAKAALEEFTNQWEIRQPMELITTHTTLENMVLTTFNADNDVDAWGRLTFKATFQQVNFVSLETQAFPVDVVQGSSNKGLDPDASASAVDASNAGGSKVKSVTPNSTGNVRPQMFNNSQYQQALNKQMGLTW